MSAAASVNVRSCHRLVTTVSNGTKRWQPNFLCLVIPRKMYFLVLIAKWKKRRHGHSFKLLLTLLRILKIMQKTNRKTKLLSFDSAAVNMVIFTSAFV